METVIDWSKAPSWATAVGKCYGSLAWIGEAGYCFQGISNPPCHPYKAGKYTQDKFIVVARRPLPWTGEGWPPVGTHVVVHDDGSLVYGQGESGEVLAHVDGCAVIRMSYGLGCFLPRCLRTPAQIEEENRIASAYAMCKIAPSLSNTDAVALYDAGYRKQVAP
ncbi:hypothetical protein [Pseudomonas phage HU1]|nr:hypothetical protein [Pseudomonas phage HU1]